MFGVRGLGAGTFLGAELLELVLLLLVDGLQGERRRLLVNLPQQAVLHAHGGQVPAGDEAAAHEVRAERHDLAHQHGRQDVGELVDDPHRGVHVCGRRNAVGSAGSPQQIS